MKIGELEFGGEIRAQRNCAITLRRTTTKVHNNRALQNIEYTPRSNARRQRAEFIVVFQDPASCAPWRKEVITKLNRRTRHSLTMCGDLVAVVVAAVAMGGERASIAQRLRRT